MFDWTSEIGITAFTVRLSDAFAVCESELTAWTVKLLVPDAVGVPEIVPEPNSVSPEGRTPEANDQVYGLTPPVAASVALYATFCLAPGKDAVVIASPLPAVRCWKRFCGNWSKYDAAGRDDHRAL